MLRVAMQILVWLAAWLAFLIGAVSFVARFVPVINHAVLVATAFSPYLMIGAAIAAVPLLLTGSRMAAVPGLLIGAAALALQVPHFLGSAPPVSHSVPVRVLTVNLRDGAANAESALAAAGDQTDVLVVQELTPELADRLRRTGIAAMFPYQAVNAKPYAAGIGIWSRYPITQSRRYPGYELGVASARLRVPEASSDVVVVSVHLAGPWPQPIDRWRQEMAALPETLAALADAAGPGAVIAAGDFNATTDMQPFRALSDTGFRDAAEQAGAGRTRTYPAGSTVPPLIGIDHVLTYNGSASAVHTVRIPGSDHLGVAATIHVPG